MDTLTLLQSYWWLIISLLGAILVFMLFVQGGQTLFNTRPDKVDRQLMVNSLGRKWELTYTVLVVFGGAFFASFPLFYSTSFGGAYWLWMLILVSFVVQAFSYEFRRKKGNVYGTKVYDFFLAFNGCAGCIFLGVAVGMFFFGGDFTVNRVNIVDIGSPVISQWGESHGLEAMCDWRNLLLGLAVFFLARTLGALYFINDIYDSELFAATMRRNVLVNGLIFAVLYVAFVVVLMLTGGYRFVDGSFEYVANIYLVNYLNMWWFALLLLLGTLAVLYAIFRTFFCKAWRGGIWWAGVGTIAVVLSLFCIIGYGNTAYLYSTADASSSLTIANSSSSLFTLEVMSWVSILVPFVIAYIAYVWRKMNATQLSEEELEKESHKY